MIGDCTVLHFSKTVLMEGIPTACRNCPSILNLQIYTSGHVKNCILEHLLENDALPLFATVLQTFDDNANS